MSAAASRLWAASLVRRHWRATVFLAVFAGLVGASAMTAWQFARRADSVIDRRIVELAIADASMQSCPPGIDPADNLIDCFSVDAATQRTVALQSSPHVVATAVVAGALVTISASPDIVSADMASAESAAVDSTPFHTLAGTSIGRHGTIGGIDIVDGRPVDETRADEAVLGERMARLTGLGVGDTLVVSVCDLSGDETCDRTTELQVVGIARSEGDAVPERRQPVGARTEEVDFGVQTTRAWWELNASDRSFTNTQFRLAPGSTLDDVLPDVTAALPDWSILISPNDQLTELDGVRNSTEFQSTALLAIAIIVAIAGLVFVGQTLGRQIRRELADHETLLGLGMTQRDVAIVVVLRAAPVAVGAAVIAVVTAWATSGIGLPGLAGQLESDRGRHAEATVLAVGGLAVAVAVIALLLVPGVRFCRVRARRSRATRVRAVGAALPTEARAGLAMTRGTGSGRMVRTAITGTAAAVAVFAIASTLVASLDRVTASPPAYGVSWQYTVGDFVDLSEVDDISARVVDDELIEDAAIVATSGPVEIPSVPPFFVVSFNSVKGDLAPVIIEGRAPVAADEVAIAPATLAALGKHVGDTLDSLPSLLNDATDDAPPTRDAVGPLRIVGVTLVSNDERMFGPGKGMLVTEELRGQFDPGFDGLMAVRTTPAVSENETVAQLSERYGRITVPSPQNDIENLNLIADTPWLIALMVGASAVAALGHALILNVRRHRRQFGVLRALGFTRPQVTSSIGWQASVVAVVAIAIGVPLGIVFGRWTWQLIANEIGLVAAPTLRLAGVVFAAAIVLLIANLIALWPALLAGRQNVAEALRAE